MSAKKNFIIDFDSTFTQVEALDILADISIQEGEKKEKVLSRIKEITDKAMNGELSFRESLQSRVELLEANSEHIPELIKALKGKVSNSFKRNKAFIEKYREHIYIVSNGFKDFIIPIVEDYGIYKENVYANEFEYDDNGNITGFKKENLLSNDNGKPKQISELNLEGDVYVLGDGYNDFEIKKAGLADKFYAFTENVRREKVIKEADKEAPNLDDFLFTENLERAFSYPKNRIKVLLLENVHPDAQRKLKEEGYSVDFYSGGMTEEELCEAIKDVSILGIRSKTQVTKKVLDHAKRLIGIGAFCIGTNQIDLETCTDKGIAVFNAPFSNTRSVVELAIAEIIMLMRNLPDKTAAMHEGKWNKSASMSNEVRGKTLGIVGYGKIGSQLSVIAESLGIKVVYYDIEDRLGLGNAQKCETLDELLAASDIISLHIDGRKANTNLIGEDEFAKMKDGVVFINLSRGQIVDIPALAAAIDNGKVRGSAVDVFPSEPLTNKHPFESDLRGKRNIILTPHIGGSTQEAQENIADYVPSKIMEYINTGSTSNSVNFPNITLPPLKNAHRFIHVHANEPGVLAQINKTLAEHDINVAGQYLKTNEKIGYVITDINKGYKDDVVKSLKIINGTIRFRVLY